MLIPKTMGKTSPGHVRGLHSSPSHHRPGDLEGKNGFVGQAQGPHAVCSLGTWCPVSQPLQLWLITANIELRPWLQRVKTSNLGNFHVVLSLQVHRSQKLRFGNLHLDFRRCMETPGCPGRSLLLRWNPHGEPLVRQCGRGMWGWSSHTVSQLDHCPPDLRIVNTPKDCTMHLEKLQTLNASP